MHVITRKNRLYHHKNNYCYTHRYHRPFLHLPDRENAQLPHTNRVWYHKMNIILCVFCTTWTATEAKQSKRKVTDRDCIFKVRPCQDFWTGKGYRIALVGRSSVRVSLKQGGFFLPTKDTPCHILCRWCQNDLLWSLRTYYYSIFFPPLKRLMTRLMCIGSHSVFHQQAQAFFLFLC